MAWISSLVRGSVPEPPFAESGCCCPALPLVSPPSEASESLSPFQSGLFWSDFSPLPLSLLSSDPEALLPAWSSS